MPMSSDTILAALDQIEAAIDRKYGVLTPKRLLPPESTSYPIPLRAAQHIKWLVTETRRMVREDPSRREKIMRWLAFAQGWAWTVGLTSIEELKDANRSPGG